MSEDRKEELEQTIAELEEAIETETDSKKLKTLKTQLTKANKELEKITSVEPEILDEQPAEIVQANTELEPVIEEKNELGSFDLFFTESFWCVELGKTIKKGVYTPKSEIEASVLTPKASKVRKIVGFRVGTS